MNREVRPISFQYYRQFNHECELTYLKYNGYVSPGVTTRIRLQVWTSDHVGEIKCIITGIQKSNGAIVLNVCNTRTRDPGESSVMGHSVLCTDFFSMPPVLWGEKVTFDVAFPTDVTGLTEYTPEHIAETFRNCIL